MFNVKCATSTDKLTGNLYLSSTPWSFKHLSAHCFGFQAHNITVLVQSCCCHQYNFQMQNEGPFSLQDFINSPYGTFTASKSKQS